MPENLDDLLADLDDDDPDNTPLVQRLRSALKARNKDLKELDDLRKENGELKRSSVIRDAGLELKPSQVTALLAAHGDKELTADLLHETAVDLGWAEPKQDVPPEDLEATDRIAAATTGAPTGRAATGTITAADVSDWPVDKIARFRDSHPAEFEALKRGEPVRGIAAFS